MAAYNNQEHSECQDEDFTTSLPLENLTDENSSFVWENSEEMETEMEDDVEEAGDVAAGDTSSLDHQLNCPYCPKLFASNWHLKRHMLTHTRENRFKCDVCQKDFSRNDNLKAHLRTIHGVIVPSRQKSST